MPIFKGYRVVAWNTNGLKPKITEFTNYLTHNNIDVALLTETKLTPNDVVKIKNYIVYRVDRPTNGGGVAIAVKNIVDHTPTATVHTNLETVGIKLKNNTHLYALYIRPNYRLTNRDLDTIFDRHNRVIVAGDLNSRHTAWKNHLNNANGNTLYNYYLQNNINIQYTQEPTHYPPNGSTPTYIDILLNKNVNEATDPYTETALSSDHNPVRFEIKSNRNDLEEPPIQKLSFKNTNWEDYKTELNGIIEINNKISNKEELNAETEKLTSDIKIVMDKHSTTLTIHPYRKQISDEIVQKIKEKNRIRREWQRTRNPAIKELMNRKTREVKEALSQHYNESWNKTLEKINENEDNNKKLWKIIKRIKRGNSFIPALNHNGQTYYTNYEKANVLASNLAQTQTNPATSDIENEVKENIKEIDLLTTDKDSISPLLTSPREVKNIIKYLPNNKAPGPDQIPNIVLKNLPHKAIVQLTYIINTIFKLQTFPDPWKTALIIPIHKKQKDKDNPNSYRPISLLNAMSKVAEKIINKRLAKQLKEQQTLIDEQFGFRPGHSTVLQVTRISHDIVTNFNKEKVTVMTLIDIQKAFDTVWRDGLLHKMKKQKIATPLIKIIKSYLADRYIQVKVQEQTSNRFKIEAGVPQGSVLGPALFNLFINDIPKFQNTQLAIYADDTALYAHSYYAQAAQLQNQIHIDLILKYFETWKIKINSEKTENIIFTRKFTNDKVQKQLKVQNLNIQQTKSVKYLGVWMDRSLRYHIHATKIMQQYRAALKTLYPLLNSRSKLTPANKKKIYTAVLRPVLTYAAPILVTLSRTQKMKMQRLQNKTLRLILTADRYIPIDQLHAQAQMQPLVDYINKLAVEFYSNSIQNSPLTAHLDTINNNKHKVPFQHLQLP